MDITAKITGIQYDAEFCKKTLKKISYANFDVNTAPTKCVIESDEFSYAVSKWVSPKRTRSYPYERVYGKIGKKLGIKFHGEKGIDNFKEKIDEGVEKFKKFSRSKAEEAQNRERQTQQPKEALSTLSKATITIHNYLGGEYYLTTDEIVIKDNELFLIEGKHTKAQKLPSLGDIKDGLLKLILYTNLEEVEVNEKGLNVVPVLKLTSEKISGSIRDTSSPKDLETFFVENFLSARQKQNIKELIKEAKKNHFNVVIEWATT